jgi:hypothetical protein
MTVAEFADRAHLLGLLLGASVTSWGRTEVRNAAVGGVALSAHRAWLAVDLVYDVAPPEATRRELARRLGLRLLPEADHDHVQPWGWAAG